MENSELKNKKEKQDLRNENTGRRKVIQNQKRVVIKDKIYAR